MSRAALLILLLAAMAAAQQPNIPSATLIWGGVDGPPWPIDVVIDSTRNQRLDLQVVGVPNQPYLITNTPAGLLPSGLATPFGLLDQNFAQSYLVVLDGFNPTASVLGAFATTGSSGSSEWVFPISFGSTSLIPGLQAAVGDPAAAGGFALTAATRLEITTTPLLVPGDPVHVSPGGSDVSGRGTAGEPVETIAFALALAQSNGSTEVRVAAGTYVESVLFEDGISVLAGFDANFAPDPLAITRVEVGCMPARADGIVAPTTLRGLTFVAASGTPVSPSSIAFEASNCSSNLVFLQCSFEAGDGSNGMGGVPGIPGIAGQNGFPGTDARSRGTNGSGSPAPRKGFGGGAGGDVSGGGGIGSPGLPGLGPCRGAGGPGGPGGSVSQGPGGPGFMPTCVGADGLDGAASPLQFLSMGTVTTGVAASGGDGLPGSGAGGGGGGGGTPSGTFTAARIGGLGGSGGEGGGSGTGGQGGTDGGSSIGLVLVASHAHLQDCLFLGGQGGTGGSGGAGGAGAPGGSGGAGAPGSGVPGSGDGARGGPGGNGAPGGGGGGGAGGNGGSSIGVLHDAASAPTLSPGTQLLGGQAGFPGFGGMNGNGLTSGADGLMGVVSLVLQAP